MSFMTALRAKSRFDPRVMLVVGVLSVLSACAAHDSPQLAPGVLLIAPDEGPLLVRQCSRVSPEIDGAFFTPTEGQLAALETALAATLEARRADYSRQGDPPAAFGWPQDRAGYLRQYVGYTQAGRQMIYGNFLPATSASGPQRPAVVCDGGPQFFGVEYDIAGDRIVRIAFNGGLGGPILPPIEP